MQYELLEESQPLNIILDGPILDTMTLGVLQMQLQEITDKVTYALLAREELFEQQQRSNRPRRLYFLDDDRIVKARVSQIHSGSMHEEVTFAVLSVLADPDVRSVLLGVASNIVYAIGTSGVKGVVRRAFGRREHEKTNRVDPFNVSANVRVMLRAMAANSNGGKMTLKLSHQHGDEKIEVEIQIEG